MSRFKSARGGVSVRGLLTLVIIAFMIYEAIQFVPVLFAQWEFKDAVVEEAKFSRGKDVWSIKNSLTSKAAELGLPVAADQISVHMQGTRVRVQVRYKLSVEWLPGKEYSWDVNEVAESVIF